MKILTVAAVSGALLGLGIIYARHCMKLTKYLIESAKLKKKTSTGGGEGRTEVDYEEGSLENLEDGTYEEIEGRNICKVNIVKY